MIATKRAIPRRTMLRGVGAALALPLLDSMVPAFVAIGKTAAAPLRRLGVIYVPNGMNMRQWTPAAEGPAFELSPTLQPLAPFRDRMLVVSGLSSHVADALPGEGGGDHGRAQATFLTGVHPKKTQGSDIRAGISMDQIAAAEFGKQTQLASLELSLDAPGLLGSCEAEYSCAYTGTLAWRTETTPLPMETDPRAVFERLFGAAGSTDPEVRKARARRDRSILDAVNQDVASIQRGLGPSDRLKLTEYLDAVRDVERRIQMAERQGDQKLPVVEQPAGIPDSFSDYAEVMYDLMALAYQTNLTRVATYLISREQSNRAYPEAGVPEAHHPMSHHQGNPESLAKLAKINTYHVQLFAQFLEKLRSTPDGDGSLLDHSAIIYGSGISDPNIHNHHDLPILLMGGGAGQIKGGRHLRVEKDTPLANLHLTVLEKLGFSVERFGDSTGEVALVSGV